MEDADAGVFDIRWDPVVEEEQLEQGPDECPALQPKVSLGQLRIGCRAAMGR